jgi:hypothetical protein
MANSKPKIGTAIKKVAQVIGIEPCIGCEEREFSLNRLNHKRPIIKIDTKDKDNWNNPKTANKTDELYLKYFGLDNTLSENPKIIERMKQDLTKLFE